MEELISKQSNNRQYMLRHTVFKYTVLNFKTLRWLLLTWSAPSVDQRLVWRRPTSVRRYHAMKMQGEMGDIAPRILTFW